MTGFQRRFRTLLSLGALFLLSLTATALSADVTTGALVLSDAWTRATPPRAMAAGGFISILNSGAKDDRLIEAISPVAGRVELHEMAIENGIMTMREKTGGILLPAGETVALKPGGLHIMFMQLHKDFEEGQIIPVTLTFETAPSIRIEMQVAPLGTKSAPSSAASHSSGTHSLIEKQGGPKGPQRTSDEGSGETSSPEVSAPDTK